MVLTTALLVRRLFNVKHTKAPLPLFLNSFSFLVPHIFYIHNDCFLSLSIIA